MNAWIGRYKYTYCGLWKYLDPVLPLIKGHHSRSTFWSGNTYILIDGMQITYCYEVVNKENRLGQYIHVWFHYLSSSYRECWLLLKYDNSALFHELTPSPPRKLKSGMGTLFNTAVEHHSSCLFIFQTLQGRNLSHITHVVNGNRYIKKKAARISV